jgi:hypothetical protein
MARAELRRKVRVTQNEVGRTLTVEQVAYRRLGEKAIAGDLKALSLLLALAKDATRAEPIAPEGAVSSEQDRAIIAAYVARKINQEGESQ